MAKHTVFKNINQRDTLFGLDIRDFLTMGVIMVLVFKINPPFDSIDRLINLGILAGAYVAIVLIKQRYPKGYIGRLLDFLFKPRIYRP